MERWDNWNSNEFDWKKTFPINLGTLNCELEEFLDAIKGDGSSILDKQMKMEQKIDGVPIRKIYIGNLPRKAKDFNLHMLFGRFGEIVHASISNRFKFYPEQNTTFGFVTYRKTDDAAAALSCLQPMILLGHRLIVAPADSWHQPLVKPDGTVLWTTTFQNYRSPPNDDDEAEANGGDDEEEEEEGAVGGMIAYAAPVPDSEVRLCPISGLNDDCLFNIFSYLHLDEQIVASRVCKRWKTIVNSMTRSIQSLDFGALTWEEMNLMDPNSEPHKLDELLVYLGRNLTEISFAPRSVHHPHGGAVISIARHCPKLETLKLANINIARRSLGFLAKQCPRLKSVSFANCQRLSDHDVITLLERCKNLESLDLTHMPSLRGKCLTSLKEPLKSLTLDDCTSIIPEFLILGLAEVSESLRCLNLKSCVTLKNNDVLKIIRAVPKLESLNLARFFPYFTECSLVPIGQMAHLKALDLSLNCIVNDGVLGAVATGCRGLETLHVSGCGGSVSSVALTQEGLAKLAALTELRELSVCYLEQATDHAVRQIARATPRLRRLNCRSCLSLSDAGLASVIASCRELERLDVTGCSRLTDALIKSASDSLKQRPNEVKLQLIVGGTSISHQEVAPQTSQLLSIDYLDDGAMRIPSDGCVDEIFFHTDSDEDDLSDICDGIDCNCCLPYEYDDDDDDFDLNWSPFHVREIIEFYS